MRFPALVVALVALLALVLGACSPLGLGGNPVDTSRPDTDDPDEIEALCLERLRAIRDWHEEEKLILSVELFRGEIGFRESVEKEEALEEQAEKMEAEVEANCCSDSAHNFRGWPQCEEAATAEAAEQATAEARRATVEAEQATVEAEQATAEASEQATAEASEQATAEARTGVTYEGYLVGVGKDFINNEAAWAVSPAMVKTDKGLLYCGRASIAASVWPSPPSSPPTEAEVVGIILGEWVTVTGDVHDQERPGASVVMAPCTIEKR